MTDWQLQAQGCRLGQLQKEVSMEKCVMYLEGITVAGGRCWEILHRGDHAVTRVASPAAPKGTLVESRRDRRKKFLPDSSFISWSHKAPGAYSADIFLLLLFLTVYSEFLERFFSKKHYINMICFIIMPCHIIYFPLTLGWQGTAFWMSIYRYTLSQLS